jgi:hypothetical protein
MEGTRKDKHRPRRTDAFGALTASEIARIWQVTPQAVGLWVKRGSCPRNPDGTYNLTAVIAWREAQAAGVSDGVDWRERNQRALALINEHDLAVKRGQYIETASAASWWADRVTEARVALQGVGAGMAPSLVGQDVQTIARLLDERLREICETLARKVEDALTDEPTQEAE